MEASDPPHHQHQNDDTIKQEQIHPFDDSYEQLLIALPQLPDFVNDRLIPGNWEQFTGTGFVKRLRCRFCEKTFRHVENKRRHVSAEHPDAHLGAKRHKMKHQHVSAKHKDAQMGTKQYNLPCPKCDRMFNRTSCLTKHLKKKHTKKDIVNTPLPKSDKYWNADLEKFVCDLCGKPYALRKHLTMHLNVHAKEAQQKKKLKSHTIWSVEKYPNVDFEYKTQPDSSERPESNGDKMEQIDDSDTRDSDDPMEQFYNAETGMYHCDQCDWMGFYRSKMENHFRLHGGQDETIEELTKSDSLWNEALQMYECDQCDKKCVHRNHITNHLKKHTVKMDVKKYWSKIYGLYVCTQCDIKFVNRRGITMHLNANPNCVDPVVKPDHLGSQPEETGATLSKSMDPYWNSELNLYECDECDKKCILRNHLTNHLKKHANKHDLSIYWNKKTNLFECKRCDIEFVERKGITQHLNENSECASAVMVKPMPICEDPESTVDQEFKTEEDAEDYVLDESSSDRMSDPLWNNELKLYECDQCDTKSVHPLTNHLKLHNMVKPMPIGENPETTVDQEFKTEEDAEEDVIDESSSDRMSDPLWNNELKLYECDQCDTKSVHPLTNHLKLHNSNMDLRPYRSTVNSRFECKRCDTQFIRRIELIRHLKLNSDCLLPDDKNLDHSVNVSMSDDDAHKYWNAELGLYTCDQCDKTFSHRHQITIHVNSHEKHRRNEIEFWKKLTNDSEMIDYNKLTHPGAYLFLNKYWNESSERYECDQCDKTYVSRKPMTKHLWAHDAENGRSTIIETVFLNPPKSDNDVVAQLSSSSSDESEIDGNEQCSSDDSINMDRDLDSSSPKPLICAVCTEMCDHQSVLQRHVRNVHENKCTWVSNAPHSDKSGLDSSKTLQKTFKCKICTKRFQNRARLNRHTKRKHLHPNQLSDLGHYTCDQCDKTFTNRRQITIHVNSHEKHRRNEIEFWKKLTNDSEMIDYDKLTHPGAYLFLNKYWNESSERYECDQCDKTYVSRKPMTKHLWAHDAENGRSNIIETVFLNPPKLDNDVVAQLSSSSSDETEIDGNEQCSSDDSINMDSDLDSSSPKPLICAVCTEKFDHQSALIRHVRNVHENKCAWVSNATHSAQSRLDSLKTLLKTFECKICTKRFQNRAKLNRHTKRKHLDTNQRSHLLHSDDLVEYSNDKDGFQRHHCSLSTKISNTPENIMSDSKLEETNGLSPQSEYDKNITISANTIGLQFKMDAPMSLDDKIDPIKLDEDESTSNKFKIKSGNVQITTKSGGETVSDSDDPIRLDDSIKHRAGSPPAPTVSPDKLNSDLVTNRFFCLLCFDYFQTLAEYENHPHYQCSTCSIYVNSPERLQQHTCHDSTR